MGRGSFSLNLSQAAERLNCLSGRKRVIILITIPKQDEAQQLPVSRIEMRVTHPFICSEGLRSTLPLTSRQEASEASEAVECVSSRPQALKLCKSLSVRVQAVSEPHIMASAPRAATDWYCWSGKCRGWKCSLLAVLARSVVHIWLPVSNPRHE